MLDVWVIVRALHLLAMGFFVGGQLMLAAVVVPAMRGGDRERLRAIARGFGWGTLAAIGVLIATGVAMATHFATWGETSFQVKLALVAAVVVLIAWHLRKPTMRALDGAIFIVSLAIVWLGVSIAH